MLLINELLQAIDHINRLIIEEGRCEIRISPAAYRQLNVESNSMFYNKFSDLLMYDGDGNMYLADIPLEVTNDLNEKFEVVIK